MYMYVYKIETNPLMLHLLHIILYYTKCYLRVVVTYQNVKKYIIYVFEILLAT